jgi:hypothetical protein
LNHSKVFVQDAGHEHKHYMKLKTELSSRRNSLEHASNAADVDLTFSVMFNYGIQVRSTCSPMNSIADIEMQFTES